MDEQISYQSEGKFQILMEQNMRLIKIANKNNEEKEQWRSKYEIMENAMNKKVGLLEKKTKLKESQRAFEDFKRG